MEIQRWVFIIEVDTLTTALSDPHFGLFIDCGGAQYIEHKFSQPATLLTQDR
jgi:hypothetical protein